MISETTLQRLKNEVPLFIVWLKQKRIYKKFLTDATRTTTTKRFEYNMNDSCPIYQLINLNYNEWRTLDEEWHRWINLNKNKEI